MQGNTIKTFQIPNRLPDLVEISQDVFEWFDELPISAHAKYASRLAIEEWVSNTIKYGYDDDGEHFITLSITLDDRYLGLTFEDDGRPFDPTAREPISIEDAISMQPAGGIGLELLLRLCDDISYVREDGLNRLSLFISKMDPDHTPHATLQPM
ncbi:MAG: ATP-binding protein [Verrucomicrobiota bacterium]|jgi:anti-sigma regulatory factor (Ser/Thr protein kinase)|nr:ATP-binding protein [Verrucomicrobiota bacterium]